MNIVFDFDGTIADTNECITECFNAALESFSMPTFDRSVIKTLIGLPLRNMYAQILNIDDIYDEQVERLFLRYRELFPDISMRTVRLFPGVSDTLRRLHERGVRMAIATSRGHESLEMMLRHFDIDQYITVCFCEEDVVNKKPAPDMVLKALESLCASAADTWVVGDTWYDIAMGQGAGCHTCGVTYGNHTSEMLLEHGADIVVEEFSRVAELTV